MYITRLESGPHSLSTMQLGMLKPNFYIVIWVIAVIIVVVIIVVVLIVIIIVVVVVAATNTATMVAGSGIEGTFWEGCYIQSRVKMVESFV